MQTALTYEQTGSPKITIPHTIMKEMFSFDDHDKSSDGWRL